AYVMGLNWPRPKLYQRINMRVDIMVQQGLAAEIEGLLRAGVPQEAQAMKGIGYKEILAAINGQMTMEQAIDKVKQNSRHFAKRQVTWYRRMPYIHWYQPDLYQRDGLLANALWDIKGYFGIK
ncbi:MAG: tRNA dimethylallyltransferase, partial [Anaerovibrio sp.]|nr:tRNA dimethylallyltransferase [Anaerovibrio sp.]